MEDKNKDAVRIYDEIAEDYANNYDSVDGDEDLVFLQTFLSRLGTNSRIVDAGCGTGFSSGFFVNNKMEAEGFDLSPRMIEIAKRNYPNIKFSIADMRTFVPESKTDAVWAGYSLFHFVQSDLEKTLEIVKTYLMPNGIFGLVVQEGEGEVEIPEPFLPNKTIYLHLYTEQQLSAILSNHGFEILDIKRKHSVHPNEFSFNKLLFITRRK